MANKIRIGRHITLIEVLVAVGQLAGWRASPRPSIQGSPPVAGPVLALSDRTIRSLSAYERAVYYMGVLRGASALELALFLMPGGSGRDDAIARLEAQDPAKSPESVPEVVRELVKIQAAIGTIAAKAR